MRNNSCACTAFLVGIGAIKLNFVAYISKLATINMTQTKPQFLIVDDIISLISKTKEELTTILEDLKSVKKPYLKKSVFIYSYSLFESTLYEYLKEILKSDPSQIDGGKLDGKELKYTKNSTFSFEIIEHIIIDWLNRESYKNLDQIIKKVCEILNVEKETLIHNDKKVTEIKERRNIVVHNNSVIDKKYIQNVKCKETDFGKTIDISEDYLKDSIKIVIDILDKIQEATLKKYSEFTRQRLIRDTWEYFFKTPILKFDTICRFYNEQDFQIYNSDEIIKVKDDLASSERTLLAYFLQNYNPMLCDRIFKFSDLNMQVSTTKYKEIVEVFERYPLLLQS